jgi:hypothetical protein
MGFIHGGDSYQCVLNCVRVVQQTHPKHLRSIKRTMNDWSIYVYRPIEWSTATSPLSLSLFSACTHIFFLFLGVLSSHYIIRIGFRIVAYKKTF